MKLYVINLDRAPERRARISKLLGDMGVPYERVPAVDGRTLPPPPAAAPNGGYLMSPAETACARSHQKCWDLFERSGEPYCVVLEDDVHFGSDFAAFMTGGPSFPHDFDLIKIEATPFKVWLDRHNPLPMIGQRLLVRLASHHMGSAGYVLSRSGLEKLREITRTFEHPIDEVLFGKPAQAMTIYQMLPSLVIQDNGLKNISPQYLGLAGAIDRGRKPRIGVLKKVAREIARPLQPYWPPGPFRDKWRLSYMKVTFE
jgi:glycosyl transferase family 25